MNLMLGLGMGGLALVKGVRGALRDDLLDNSVLFDDLGNGSALIDDLEAA